jgi:serine/threonine protein kinase
MTSGDWIRVKELFEAAQDLEPAERDAFLAQSCHDRQTREQVEKLISNYLEAGTFLDQPAFACLEERDSARDLPLERPDTVAVTTLSGMEIEDPMAGRRLGAYRLVRRIGKGGMGAVFLAVRADDEYQKEVAIKLVEPGPDSRALLNRFRTERQTLAGLDHPNIVKLLDGGSTQEGLPFLVMDYVAGSPIDDYSDAQKLCVDERLRLFLQVCEAVQYAHQKSVVHRDLKPGNILVTTDGTPKLLDFGIAKVLNPQPSAQNLHLTQTGVRCMTPAYASPEQMRCKPITSASDIYSLGVVLYELLTGHRPYRLTQNTPAEMERAICEQEPEAPSTAVSRVESVTSSDGTPIARTPELVSQTREGQPDKLRRRLRGDLDNIVLKALQKEPQRRYGSVAEFSQDIGRHLQHLPVKARPSTLAYRVSKFVQRHKTEVSAALIVVFVLIAAASLAFNTLGLRERILGGVSGSRIQSLNAAPSFHPKGWVSAGAAGAKPVVSCKSLANLKLPDTTITSTQSVTAGSLTPTGADPIQNLPAFCRVEGVVKPTKDSDVRFEVWVPSSGWNGKFLAVGNGGFAGVINYDEMVPAVRAGYATASTDTGHRGDDMDAKWALGHPERVVDFGYRAIHEMTEKSKEVIQAFYGQAPQWSYFEGCSNGGREALMEAQRFPEDYQGILAGAPPIPVTRLLAAGLYNTTTSPSRFIPPSKIPVISNAVLAACDALDGVSDGILNDPRQCQFDPTVLRCQGANSESCLTAEQVLQLKNIYAGLHNTKGQQLYPGYPPGGEQGEQGWGAWLTGEAPGQAMLAMFGLAYFRNMVFENPGWDYRTSSVQRVIDVADLKTTRIVDAADPNLKRFKDRGGKIILYHGWSDAATSGFATIQYYDNVVASMGLPETQSFLRLYMAPGMQHCAGGPGPNYFGQVDLSTLSPNTPQASTNMDPQHNISKALEQWVEKGVAPATIIATKYVNALDPTQGVKMTRPLCPYSQVAVYKGVGDTNDAENFACTKVR